MAVLWVGRHSAILFLNYFLCLMPIILSNRVDACTQRSRMLRLHGCCSAPPTTTKTTGRKGTRSTTPILNHDQHWFQSLNLRGGNIEANENKNRDEIMSTNSSVHNSNGNNKYFVVEDLTKEEKDNDDESASHDSSSFHGFSSRLQWNSSPAFSSSYSTTKKEDRSILGRAVLTTPHRRMPAIRIAPGPLPPFLSPKSPGPIMTAEPIFITKFTLSESLGCALRDLRLIDSFAPGGRYAGPAFLARKNGVIIHVGHVRAIVMRNQVLIFLPELGNNGNGHTDPGNQLNHHLHDFGTTGGMSSPGDIIHVIEQLIEALVDHLNSIYHDAPLHMFPQEAKMDKESTKSSMAWGWNQQQHEPSLPTSSALIVSSSSMQPLSNDQARKRFLQWPRRNKSSKPTITTDESKSATATELPPFELVVIEALLGHVCSHEAFKASQLLELASEVLAGITMHTHSSDNSNHIQNHTKNGRRKDTFMEMQAKLAELLPLKNQVDMLEAKCSEVAGAIAEVLKHDEDMAAMRLSAIQSTTTTDDASMMTVSPNDNSYVSNDAAQIRRTRRQHSSDSRGGDFVVADIDQLHVEVELLFEDYLLQMDEVLYSLRSVQSSIRNTEEVVEIELDLLRNRIMRYEMLLELSGLVVGCGAAITGLFGMNLVSHYEDHKGMFYNVLAFIVIMMVAMGFGILRKLSIDNII